MRENKFKVWCEFEINGKVEKCMEEPCFWFLLTQTGQVMEYGPVRPPQKPNKAYKKLIPLFYTGLKDKNGKEIYEGDIVKWAGYKDVIEFQNGSFVVASEGSWLFTLDSELEVIGNIYENKELLK